MKAAKQKKLSFQIKHSASTFIKTKALDNKAIANEHKNLVSSRHLAWFTRFKSSLGITGKANTSDQRTNFLLYCNEHKIKCQFINNKEKMHKVLKIYQLDLMQLPTVQDLSQLGPSADQIVIVVMLPISMQWHFHLLSTGICKRWTKEHKLNHKIQKIEWQKCKTNQSYYRAILFVIWNQCLKRSDLSSVKLRIKRFKFLGPCFSKNGLLNATIHKVKMNQR